MLIVDDHPISRSILGERLSEWGLVPTLVESGEAAVEHLQPSDVAADPYPLVIVDRLAEPCDGFQVAAAINDLDAFQQSRTIMISSAPKAGDLEQCRELGVARYMHKPVVEGELLDTILRLTGIREAEFLAPADWGHHRAHRKLNILLAEDGEVNRQVAIGLLQQVGHDVTVAVDGREAVEKLADGSFDLVLMDVQMPNMDGHEATRLIRSREETTGTHTPIIAMTASAMKGDREQCLESGMDGYISKPIDPQLMFDAIEQCTDCCCDRQTRAGEKTPSDAEVADDHESSRDAPDRGLDLESIDASVVDLQAVRQLCCGDDGKVHSLASTLLEECRSLMMRIETAVESRDAGALRGLAHSLKGAASVFGAREVVDSALGLETTAANGDLDSLEEAVASLNTEVPRLVDALQRIVR